MKITKLLDKETAPKKELKPIEVFYFIDNDHAYIRGGSIELDKKDASTDPGYYDNVKLISKGDKYDIIACWMDNDSTENVAVFLGKWNDGVC